MTLHIYGQQAQHDPAHIVGTWHDLRSLRDTLSGIVDDHATDAGATFFVADGEGYSLTVRLETEAALEGYALPYTAESARDHDADTSPRWPRKA